MITREELNPHGYVITHPDLFERLHRSLNILRQEFGKPMIVNSGVRSQEDQEKIDRDAGRKRATLGSAHLKCAAADIKDPNGYLWRFCKENLPLLERLGLYLEDRAFTPTWVHFQIIPPASGKRIFTPYKFPSAR